MDSKVIFAKTNKGIEEMENHTYKLSAKLRTAMFRIDGKTPIGDILVQCGEYADRVQAQIEELLAQGFIENITPETTPTKSIGDLRLQFGSEF